MVWQVIPGKANLYLILMMFDALDLVWLISVHTDLQLMAFSDTQMDQSVVNVTHFISALTARTRHFSPKSSIQSMYFRLCGLNHHRLKKMKKK